MDYITQTFPSHPDFTSWPLSNEDVYDAFANIECEPLFYRVHWLGLALDTLAVAQVRGSPAEQITRLLQCIASALRGLNNDDIARSREIIPTVLRSQFALGCFAGKNVEEIRLYYSFLDKTPTASTIDVLFFYQFLFGYTTQLKQWLSRILRRSIWDGLNEENILQARIIESLLHPGQPNLGALLNEYKEIFERNRRLEEDAPVRGRWVDFFSMNVAVFLKLVNEH